MSFTITSSAGYHGVEHAQLIYKTSRGDKEELCKRIDELFRGSFEKINPEFSA